MSASLRIYVAGALDALDVASSYASALRLAGHVVVSTWHDTVPKYSKDPLDMKARRAILETETQQIESCDLMLVDTRLGTPAGTFSEVGFAVALKKRIVWVGPVFDSPMIRRLSIFNASPLVANFHTPDAGLEAVKQWSKVQSMRPTAPGEAKRAKR